MRAQRVITASDSRSMTVRSMWAYQVNALLTLRLSLRMVTPEKDRRQHAGFNVSTHHPRGFCTP